MEYFDFEGASSAHGSSNHQDDDVASVDIEFDEPEERDANFNLLLQDEPLEFPNDPLVAESAEQLTEAVDPGFDMGVYPMFRAQEPCEFCRRMGLDCFVAKRGVMQNGCTCCISLYRECSFTHAKAPGKFLQTLHPVSENAYIPTGSLTGKKALKSVSYGAFPDDSEGRSRKSNARFSRRAVNVLKGWLREHNENPYPSEQEKDELKNHTGLTRTQVSNWLANARRRGKVRAGTSSPVPGAVDIPGQQPKNPALMTPLERWKYSPPEHEPATISDISRALANPPFKSTHQRASQFGHVRLFRRPDSSTNESSHASSEHKVHVASGTSLDSSRSSLSELSFASAFSHRSSVGSFNSMDRKERRRRRKASAPANSFDHQKARAIRPFQCTFCTDSFAAKYDWQRHEKSMHLILEKWTCSPHGAVYQDNGTPRCVFCLEAHPDGDHLEQHNYMSCQEKTPQERTFYRKDHLNQHLRLMHNAKFQPLMETWRSSITDIKSRCGFCFSVFKSWKVRVDHLASHFKSGASMAHWQGDWGFDPWIQNRVENAVPPYLIDYEWRSPDPWTTVQAQGDDLSPRLNVPSDANCYLRLSRQLTAYMHDQVAQGIIPTDQMLQAEARRVIYGCDDPWNQTCADNPLWLSILKRDTGLATAADTANIELADLGMQPPFAVHGGLRAPPREANLLDGEVCQLTLISPGVSSPNLQSPVYPGTGFSSAAASGPGSLSGSYAGSTGVLSAGAEPVFSTDWANSFPTAHHSSSTTPGEAAADPLVQMGFDTGFLQRLNDSYGEINPGDMEGLQLGNAEVHHERMGGQEWAKPGLQPAAHPLLGLPASNPIAMFDSKEGQPPASDAAQRDMPAFLDGPRNF